MVVVKEIADADAEADCNGNCCNGNCKCLNGGNNNNAGNGGVAGDNVNNSGIDVSGNGQYY